MKITPVKIYYIEPDKLYAYMVGVVTIYSKYPQITPEIREQIEMDIAEQSLILPMTITTRTVNVYCLLIRKYMECQHNSIHLHI